MDDIPPRVLPLIESLVKFLDMLLQSHSLTYPHVFLLHYVVEGTGLRISHRHVLFVGFDAVRAH